MRDRSNSRVLRILILLLLCGCATDVAATQRPPNIVFFLIDDLGWRDLGFMGSRYYETPRIDRLAMEGLVFSNAYANAPNCAPSRACLMSGLYTPRHGVYTVGSPARGKAKHRKLVPTQNRTDLDGNFVTIAELLQQQGYATAHVGKWHLGDDPTTQGFDVNIGGNKSGSPRGGYFAPYKNPQLPNGPKGEHLTARLTDEAIDFVRKNRETPFFLHLAHYAVHTPIQAVEERTEKYRNKSGDGHHNNPKYAAMVESVDISVGRILDVLDELDLRDNTLVVFFSDNGGHGNVTGMHPLRGAKGMLYEGGIRVPMIMAWPGRIRGGSCETPVLGIDLFQTFAELGGAKPERADGVSLTPLLDGEELPARSLHWHFPAYLQATKRSKNPWRTTPAAAIRQGDWKLIEFFEDGRLELYDLGSDIGETRNLAEQHPDRVAAMHDQMKAWRESVAAPVPRELNPKFDPDAGR